MADEGWSVSTAGGPIVYSKGDQKFDLSHVAQRWALRQYLNRLDAHPCAHCHKPFESAIELYRCLDCDSPLHKECLALHLGKGRWHDRDRVLMDLEARAQAAEADADRYKKALEDVYDAWVDSDAHNRCAPGDCVKCDATYAAYASALAAISGKETT